MAHYAKIENGIVTNVIVAEQDFIDEYHSGETWVQTSYNTSKGVHYQDDDIRDSNGKKIPSTDQSKALRGNYAGIGYTYDSINDVFYQPKPFVSWVLNSTTWDWEAPISQPDTTLAEGKIWDWNEDAYQADNTQGWVEIDN